MVETKKNVRNNDKVCIYAKVIYCAFVLSLMGVFSCLLCSELAKGGDQTLQIGLGTALVVSTLFLILTVVED